MASNEEDRYLMLSGLQHFQFCKRQWALIHIEQQWEENVKTVEGQHLHKKADQPFIKEKRGSKLTVRAMPIQSKELRISGICDVVEFIEDANGVHLNGVKGTYMAYPVEYKRGKPKKGDEDIIQLAAQAICLEEMLLCQITKGYLFYNEIKHRVEVPITDELREKVKQMAKEMHHYYDKRYTPKVKTGPFCKSCSLQHICLPKLMNKRSVKSYIEGRLSE
ncbi:CRISPR-associated protein Cas4 [Halalkalibacter hemicellulosilyticus]|uniref:CRISPR-associated exonuclease Cas4 n=1 Tax=Halalkalibacter hemicellulosilyticusJCM 9152 TaxID=1236971 RepID=W4Q9T3_9BACI|nr:CRISPR-associated protein Cas4 [Halalkalibacter hemicellulosilyticus]GAE28765.1 CRISPR-associated RecB family exonuclease Cas4b [Halalkalibacter hemicellulosilyticusJCM 9152]